MPSLLLSVPALLGEVNTLFIFISSGQTSKTSTRQEAHKADGTPSREAGLFQGKNWLHLKTLEARSKST